MCSYNLSASLIVRMRDRKIKFNDCFMTRVNEVLKKKKGSFLYVIMDSSVIK